jgi:hypothetical protein
MISKPCRVLAKTVACPGTAPLSQSQKVDVGATSDCDRLRPLGAAAGVLPGD